MFGCPCAFVNGNMFAGLQEDRLIVRLPGEAAGRPCVIMGRTMKQYAPFPEAVRLTPEAMAQWVQRGHAFTQALPAKMKKAAKSAKTAAAPKPVKALRAAAAKTVKALSRTPAAKC